MTDRELCIALREMARGVGLCDAWYGEWGDDDGIDACLDRYVRGQDFAIEHDWPGLEFIRGHFRREDLHRHHIYLDEEVDLDVRNSGVWVFLGDCRGVIRFGGFAVGRVYLRHGCDVRVVQGGMSRVVVSRG